MYLAPLHQAAASDTAYQGKLEPAPNTFGRRPSSAQLGKRKREGLGGHPHPASSECSRRWAPATISCGGLSGRLAEQQVGQRQPDLLGLLADSPWCTRQARAAGCVASSAAMVCNQETGTLHKCPRVPMQESRVGLEEELTTCLVVCSYLPRSKKVPVAVQAEMKTMRCLGAPGAPALRCLRPRCAALTRPVPLSAARPAGARAAPRRALPADKAELEPQPAQAKVGARGGLSAPRFDRAAGAHHARAARAGRAGGRGPVALFRAAAALLPAGPGRGRAV